MQFCSLFSNQTNDVVKSTHGTFQIDLSTDPKNDALIEVIGEKCIISA